MAKIPYIITHYQNGVKPYIEHNSVSEFNLNETLFNELRSCMDYYEFFNTTNTNTNNYTNEALTCDECGCIVTSKKYIHVNSDRSRTCGACTEFVITKEVFNKFVSFLNKKGDEYNILYFKNNQWTKFVVDT
jgi:hypothetical protein